MKTKKPKKSIFRESLARLTDSYQFQKWVRSVRIRNGLSYEGKKYIGTDEDEKTFYNLGILKEIDEGKYQTISDEVKIFCEKNITGGMDTMFIWENAITMYIVCGEIAIDDVFYGCYMAPRSFPTKRLVKLSKKMVGIFIFPHANKTQVRRYIYNVWSIIEDLNKNDLINNKPVLRKDLDKMNSIGSFNLLKIKPRREAETHRQLFLCYLDGKIKASGELNLDKVKSWDELGLPCHTPANAKLIIIRERKKMRQEDTLKLPPQK